MLETRPITSTRLLPYVCPFGTSEGPIDCQMDGPGMGGAPNALARRARTRGFRRLARAVAALTMVAAKDFAAGCVRRARRAWGAPNAGARTAALVSPNLGLAARGTATVATT